MEIICAGLPKTGTKSCSLALRVLDYNVADMRENLIHMGEIYKEYCEGRVGIEAVLGSSW
jgi:broad-specificity NMP kinase